MHSQLSVTIQPQTNPNLGTPESNQSTHINEKSLETSFENSHHPSYRHCEHGQIPLIEVIETRSSLFLLPIIFVFVALSGLFAWSCVNGMPAWGPGSGLTGRAPSPDSKGFIGQLAPLTRELLNSNLIISYI
jgi:hypothetical protein